MNVERLVVLAEWLEAGAPHTKGIDSFYMPDIFTRNTDIFAGNECRTKACLAGAAIQFFGEKEKAEEIASGYLNRLLKSTSNAQEYAQELLNINEDEADKLFFPDSYGGQREIGKREQGAVKNLREVTPAWAARVIRKFITTGEIDWDGTREET